MFPTHTPGTAPKASKPILEGISKKYGFTPNLSATLAEAPTALNGYVTLSGIFASKDNSLSAVEQQIVLLAASAANGCDYCRAAHGTIASTTGLAREDIVAIQHGRPVSDTRQEALRLFTTLLLEKRGWAEEADVQALLDAGFTRAAVLEVITGLAVKTISNYVNHIAKPDLDEQFAGFAYEPHQEA